MKRLLMFLIIISCTAVIYAQAPSAVIKEMTGTVELQRTGSADWVAAQAGDRIEQDTIVSTGFKSSATLTVGSSTLYVRPITRLSLKELTAQNETEVTNIALNTGRIRVEVNPPAGGRTNFTVQSPSSTASVRGTSFEMDPVSITVLTGAVSYSPAGSDRAVTVSAGQTTEVNTDTGSVIIPMVAADTERSLPALAGQRTAAVVETVSDSGTSVIKPSGNGTAVIIIGLDDGK